MDLFETLLRRGRGRLRSRGQTRRSAAAERPLRQRKYVKGGV
ncbi:hypothetical protein Ga0080559_TMP438 (plasmid) [Salipiger profundus]|uniref:Uncharacterized protein n=1 Tax=Salipiger profundus TaxID=1229727 RepID=A0A1U7DCN5_9RHOB|nr:hypothetical protein Ga0080559_TMP438 [Salipiger profundus]